VAPGTHTTLSPSTRTMPPLVPTARDQSSDHACLRACMSRAEVARVSVLLHADQLACRPLPLLHLSHPAHAPRRASGTHTPTVARGALARTHDQSADMRVCGAGEHVRPRLVVLV
jgi:hypothetical protein